MAALDAPTQPRMARSRQLRCPAPPPRRVVTPAGAATIGTEPPRTGQRVRTPVAPTHTLARPSASPDPEPEPRRSLRWVGVLAGALVAGLATGAALAVSGIGVLPRSRPGPTSAQALGAVQRLGPQQSSPQTVQSTFTLDPSSLPFDVSDPIRYRAVGQAQATVDLGAVGASDLHVRGTRISVRIPAAQVDPPAVDDSQSGVVNRRLLDSVDVSLGDVRTQVEQQLSKEAQTQGIPATAQALATQQVRAVLGRLGFTTIDVSVTGG